MRTAEEYEREINRLRESVAAVMVDRDRQVRAASARPLDCADHGRVIAELEKQLHYFSTTYRTTDHQRMVLVQGYWQMRDSFEALRKRLADGDEPPPVDVLAAAVIEVLSEALRDHDRPPPPAKRRPAQQALFEVTS
ncbi:hypothetical protein ABGB07_02225 [Micromonosporaceae bacterium B7E4]